MRTLAYLQGLDRRLQLPPPQGSSMADPPARHRHPGLRHQVPARAQARRSPPFNLVLYALDLLLSVLDFGRQPAFHPTGWQRWLAASLIAAGWILATPIATGLTRAPVAAHWGSGRVGPTAEGDYDVITFSCLDTVRRQPLATSAAAAATAASAPSPLSAIRAAGSALFSSRTTAST